MDFILLNKGREVEPNGSLANSSEKYNPYINSHFDVGNRFRKRVSQKDISNSKFSTYSRKDIIMKGSMFASTSIRGLESLSKLNLAKKTYINFEILLKIKKWYN